MPESEKKTKTSFDKKENDVNETQIENTNKSIGDYKKKNFYEQLGLNNKASLETIKNTYNELSKKYNPITNPDSISRYQDIFNSGETLINPVTKKFYDEYGDASVLLYNLLKSYFPFEQIEKPSNYIYAALFGGAFICICIFISVLVLLGRYDEYNVYDWKYAFLPTLVLSCGYIIYIILRTKNKINYIKSYENVEDKNRHTNITLKHNSINIFKILLLILFQYTLAYYFNYKSIKLITASIPYFIFEGICLLEDFVKFKKSYEALKSGKEIDCLLLKNNNYIKYLIGKANTKSKNEKVKSNYLYICCLLLYIYKSDIIRLLQNVLFVIAAMVVPTNYTLYFLPTYFMAFISIYEGSLQKKIGYKRGATENVDEVLKSVMYILISIDTIFILCTLNYNSISLVSQSFVFLIEIVVLIGVLLGVLPFILILEFKIKHDETDVPY